MPLKRLLKRSSPAERAAERLYDRAVAQARQPAFYLHCGVPDTLDGRFDMIALHVFLVLRRLRQGGAAAAPTSQALFDAMFADMDRSLREIGVGDLSVGRRVKAMAQALYGRIAVYDKGLESDDGSLEAALRRNVFRACSPEEEQIARLSSYVRRESDTLSGERIDGLLRGEATFGPPPGLPAA